MSMKWEYKVIKPCEESVLNKFGQEGWELIAVVKDSHFAGFYLKRPIEEREFHEE